MIRRLGFRLASRSVAPRFQSTVPKEADTFKERVTRRAAYGVLITSGLIYAAYLYKREKANAKLAALNQTQSVGKAQVGGAYRLIDHRGFPISDADLRGRFVLMYFGFCHCPDICPMELDKMGHIVDRLNANEETRHLLQPLFVTCDPQRDGVKEVAQYLKDFHPLIQGVTGPVTEVQQMLKKYRVYFSPSTDTTQPDYLVDHSVYMYVMDPDGEFVEALGNDKNVNQTADWIAAKIQLWRAQGKYLKPAIPQGVQMALNDA